MKYSKRDLKAVDIFALILFGLGLMFLVMGILSYTEVPKGISPEKEGSALGAKSKMDAVKDDIPKVKGGKVGKIPYAPVGAAIRLILFGIIFMCLGAALNIGLRRVLKNKGEDVLDPHDEVPAGVDTRPDKT